jgi:hypothetical protein
LRHLRLLNGGLQAYSRPVYDSIVLFGGLKKLTVEWLFPEDGR